MRGNVWALLIVSVFAGLMLRAVNDASPANASGATADVAGILDVLSPFAGQLLLLVGIGTFVTWTFAARNSFA